LNITPYYFCLKGIDSSPSLYNYGLKIGPYAPVSYYTKILKDNGNASKLSWADRLRLSIDIPKIKRDNEGKKIKIKNKKINKRIKTLIIKVYKIKKFDNIDIILIIYKYN